MRVGRWIVLGFATATVGGCASAGRDSLSVVATAKTVPESIVQFVEVQATEAESTTAATVAVDPARVVDCVDYVQYGAFTGDVDLLAVWDAASRDVEVLRAGCAALAVTNPGEFVAMSARWADIQKWNAAAATTEPPTTRPPVTQPPPTSPPTTAEAPPPPPPTTQPAPPVAQPPSDCNPNYSGCVPNASDVDCAGGSGNGPAYVRGPVTVIGADPYGLDRDGDGIGCEG